MNMLCCVVEALHLRISHAYFHLDFDFLFPLLDYLICIHKTFLWVNT